MQNEALTLFTLFDAYSSFAGHADADAL